MPIPTRKAVTISVSDKSDLRARVLVQRDRLPSAKRRAAGQALRDHALAFMANKPKTLMVSVFVPFRSEIDTWPLIDALLRKGYRVCLPVVVGKARPLAFYRYRAGDKLNRGAFGILTPQKTAPIVSPDLLFVPLAAFDARGYRLGYGGGFYDRTLEMLRRPGPRRLCAIGVGYDMQRVAQVPIDAYDQPLDGVMTETGLKPTRCRQSGFAGLQSGTY